MAFTNKSGRTETSMSEINVTPFVDVVLVLLIIFMVTAPVLQSGIEVNVPKTKTVKAISEQRVVISITKGQEVYLGNDHVKLAELGDMLHKKIRDPQGQSIYVRADQDVAFGVFATVMSTVKQAGITNVSIVTEPIPPEKK
jgi:biopolymer transport protein TolR